MPSNLFVMPAPKQPSAKATSVRCKRCGADVAPGEWVCADGNQHEVPAVEFTLERAISAQYCGPKPGDCLGHTTKFITLPAGRFITSDPEVQAFLDNYPGVSRRKP